VSGPADASLEPPLGPFAPAQRIAAEALGTALLLAVVIGSGIMGERLAGGNAAIALLGNTLSTVFGPISGAHFNPAVSVAFAIRRELSWRLAAAYVLAQAAGAMLGVFAAHAMFAEPILQVSAKLRDGPGQVFAEAVATFGLLTTIFGCLRFRPDFTPTAVGLYIASAYWFTASTSFANPAVTLARCFSDTFAGIAPSSAPGFWLGQAAGAALAMAAAAWLFRTGPPGRPPPRP
jgi:glycerol uptake facilitator-like aquaporin